MSPAGRPRSRSENVRLFMLRCTGRFYPRSLPARAQPAEPPRSVLLIRPDHLGDMLFLTPALHALRLALPQARIVLLAGPWSAEVVKGNLDVDEVRLCRFPGFERTARKNLLAPYRLLAETARTLRPAGFDTAVVLRFDHWWGAWLAAAAGIPRRLGYDWPETSPFLTQASPYVAQRHEIEQNGALLAALAPGAAWQLGPARFLVSEEDRAWAAVWLAEHGQTGDQPLVAIHPGAGAAVKQWPPVAWAAVAGALAADPGAAILITGGAGERPLAQAITAGLAAQSAASPVAVLDATGETTLGRLAALQERCAAVLGSDSGPLHLAVAVGAPTVHLYGPVSWRKFGPWGSPERHVVLQTDWGCAPCNRLDWPAADLPLHRCMEAITVPQVVAAARRLL